jgi:hypothetical protein
MYFDSKEFKGVIESKKTFDKCLQTLRNHIATNKIKIGQLVVFLNSS